jgi:alcohol dehydrogenase
MTDLLYNIPSQIVFGEDSLMCIAGFLGSMSRRVLIVTEAILYEKKILDKLRDFLDKRQISHITFDEVIPNSTSTSVEDGLKLARAAHIDTVIGMGGMRTLSTAKCIAMAYNGSCSVDDYLSGAEPEKPPLTYVEILTTCRNHFACTDECLIVDARDRSGKLIATQTGITKLIIADPGLCASVAPKYTATTLLDLLLASIEGYISTKSNFISDMYLAESIKLVYSLVPRVFTNKDDPECRNIASRAGLLSAMGLSTSAPGVGIGLAYAIGSKHMVPKSMLSAIFLPYVLEFNASACAQKISEVACLLGEETEGIDKEETAKRAAEAARRIIGLAGIPARLQALDLKLEDLMLASETVFSYHFTSSLPRRPSLGELNDMIKSAF